MALPILYIGNRNYSSWSLRAWLFLRHVGFEFRDVQLRLDAPEFKTRLAELGTAGRVPVLEQDGLVVWDSLAICEHAMEITGRGLPREREARAAARSASAEMHSGFTALRSAWPMNVRARARRTAIDADHRADLERIEQLWNRCRTRFGHTGAWLCGEHSLADAMFAPVATRLRTYGATLGEPAATYARTLLEDPIFREWERAAEAEPWTLSYDEAGLEPAGASR